MFNPHPKPTRVYDPLYIKWLRDQKPLIRGHGDTVPHHLKLLGGGGTGIKSSDDQCIPIADSVHKNLHQHGERRVLCEQHGYGVDDLRELAAAYYRVYLREMEKCRKK